VIEQLRRKLVTTK
jgi:Reverse transcriptase (RNA-dependent DNA polymerase)